MNYRNSLPETGYLRLRQIVGDKKSNPPIPPIYPACKSTIWKMVGDGHFPKPYKLSSRITAWKAEDIRMFLQNQKQRGVSE